jgi:ribulose-bisphosphate carboxylase large chain
MDALRATYRLRVDDPVAARERAEGLGLEQTVELPRSTLRDPFVLAQIVPEVESVEPDPEGGFRTTLAFPLATTALDPAQLLNLLFGNSSLQEDVVLHDVFLPRALREALGGPRFGIAGLRAAAGAPSGPLTCTALKPMGLAPDALAELAGTFARAGIDLIKDDHGLADHPFCRFEPRVRACQAAVEKAALETGRRALYVPNLTGTPQTVARQWRFAADCGVGAVMVAPMLIGLPTLTELLRDAPPLPVLAHPAWAGALRIAAPALLGRLFRAYGADAVIFPHAGGRFAYSAAVCGELASVLREPSPPLRPAMPVPAGGMSVERASEVVDFYGPDAMLLIGGSLYDAGDALLERTRSFVEAVSQAGSAP